MNNFVIFHVYMYEYLTIQCKVEILPGVCCAEHFNHVIYSSHSTHKVFDQGIWDGAGVLAAAPESLAK